MRLKITGLLMVAMCAVGLSACGNDDTDNVSFDASSVSCDNVQSEATSATSDRDGAQAKLADDSGTPGEKSDQKELDQANAKVNALMDRLQECEDEASATTTPSADPTPTPVAATCDEACAKQISAELDKVYKGYKPGQIKAGAGAIPKKKREAATLAFSDKTIRNRQMLGNFLKSDDTLAKQTQGRIRMALLTGGYDKAEVKRALSSGEHWMWVAPTVASQISGTTYPVKGDVVKEKGFRAVAPNDAIWWYITSDGHVLKGATVRADCGNGEVTTVTPIPPGKTPPSIKCVSHCSPPPGKCTLTAPPGYIVVNCHLVKHQDTPYSCQQANSGSNCGPNGGYQPPTSNPGQDTGGTSGAPSSPNQPSQGSQPQDGSSAPPSQQGGYDSGSGSGSGTPGGSTCSGGSCQGGGSSPGTGDGGSGTGDQSGDNSDGTVPTPPVPGS